MAYIGRLEDIKNILELPNSDPEKCGYYLEIYSVKCPEYRRSFPCVVSNLVEGTDQSHPIRRTSFMQLPPHVLQSSSALEATEVMSAVKKFYKSRGVEEIQNPNRKKIL